MALETRSRTAASRRRAVVQPRELNESVHAVSGACAGLVSSTLTYPLDVVKTRLQVQDGWSSTRTPQYRGTFDAVKTIVRTEGVRSLYSGLSVNIVGSSLAWGCYLFVYTAVKQRSSALSRNTPFTNVSAGMVAGTNVAVLTNPLWVIKTRMQLDHRSPITGLREFATALDAVRHAYSHDGPRAFARGLVPSLMLVPQGALQMMAYEELKKLTLTRKQADDAVRMSTAECFLCDDAVHQLTSTESLLMGGLSKVCALVLTYPLQVIRSRLQQKEQSSAVAQRPYHGLVDAVRKIWQREGWRGYYKGITSNMIKVVPASAITFLTYEYMVQAIQLEI